MILKGKRVWITGATGTIGGAIAARFREEGAEVFTERVEVINNEQVRRQARKVAPDVLVNCAGFYPYGSVFDCPGYQWEKAIFVNLIGSFYLTQAVLPYMRLKGGKIIHLSGGGAAYGRENYSAYSASKTGLVRFVECVAMEEKSYNIQINAIAPGSVKSKMNPEGLGGPDKAVELALYLSSQESNHITGRLIHVNEDYRKPLSEEAGKLRRIPL